MSCRVFHKVSALLIVTVIFTLACAVSHDTGPRIEEDQYKNLSPVEIEKLYRKVKQATPSEIEELIKSAEQGDAEAQGELGLRYDIGLNVKKDTSEAVKWYKKAANQGDINVQYILGCI